MFYQQQKTGGFKMYIWMIVIGAAIWVLIDARKIGVKKGLISGMGNIGPWGWFFVTLLLWIVGFPMYLCYRGKCKRAVAGATNKAITPISGSASPTKPASFAIEELEKLASLKEKGLITDWEFEAKKKQLLGI
jgi:hypothetical protein